MTNVASDDDQARPGWDPPSGAARHPAPWRVIRARRGDSDGGQGGWLGGVCAGIAASIGVDVMLVRLAFVLASPGGLGLLVYLGLWLFTPRAGERGTPEPRAAPASVADAIKVMLLVGAIFGLGGLWFINPFRLDDAGGWIGILLIGGGVLWLVRRHATADPGDVPTPPEPGADRGVVAPPPPPPPTTPPVPPTAGDPDGSHPSSTAGDASRTDVAPGSPGLARDPRDVTAPTDLAEPIDATMGLAPPEGLPPLRESATATPSMPTTAPTVTTEAGKWSLAPSVFAWLGVLAAIGLQLGAGALVGFDAVSVPRYGLLAVVATIGLATMVVAAAIRSQAGVYALGAGVIAATIAVGAAGGSFNGPVGERGYAPVTIAELRSEYRVAMGTIGVDLSRLDLEGDDEEAVRVAVGIGRADVIVPDDVDVVLTYEAQAGEVVIERLRRNGWSVSGTTDLQVDEPAGTLLVDVDVGAGSGRLCRAADADLAAGVCPDR